ncbi:YgiQ family radical SAM protein [Desulfopila inferna]|uniref:YgiQ family radical SAM protein n=1 Tax=Desulfopila inferna TaxID=468528 RepID=UPI0019648A22|nr:YgiQ family radical SAM protein [Desulfopila inferna]MBM9605127.1 YgiQ family radical SAM protein [Desulfopila inferna]
MTAEECRLRGWDAVDVVLVTGDGYIDHPSFGVALIGRLLESKGYRVAVLSQPHHDSAVDFYRFGRPRLFFGITAGNLDSIVANYTGNGKVRDFDAYSSAGNPWRSDLQSKINRKRPDRATITYANLARAAYNDVPIILGGIEASLRRFIHYDYKQNRLRSSVLTDGKADLLIYGMAEKGIVAVAAALAQERIPTGIKGCCERLTESRFSELQGTLTPETSIILPSWNDIQKDKGLFLEAELLIDQHARSGSDKMLVQQQQSNWVIQHPAPAILSEEELDELYDLPFQRTPHPGAGDIPAYRMIRHSATIVRGCSGNCSFCAITRHQGPTISSRSRASILREVRKITIMSDFFGTISDLGGPTANLYGSSCTIGGCKRHECLYPKVCEHLKVNEEKMIGLLKDVAALDEVKHVFISSGLRMELLLKTPRLLEKLITSHTPGSLKIAPEHSDDNILKIMHKESHDILRQFVKQCGMIAQKQKKKVQLTPYVITGHPGSTEKSALQLVDTFKKLELPIRQFQDFTPTPGTLSTAMFVSGLDRDRKKIIIPSASQRSRQRAHLETAFHKRSLRQSKKRPGKK